MTAVCAVFVTLALLPSVASAATPPTSPSAIRTEGFETAPGSDLSISSIAGGPGTPTTTAWWGRITQSKRSGSYGLWCAGSDSSKWALYPNYTRGAADFSLPQLADYYSSSISFYYTMPSLGRSDDVAANMLWWDTGTPNQKDHHTYWVKTGATQWLQQTWDMSATNSYVNLSRKPGLVRFQFVDSREGFLTPTNGQGATIDDLSITGYKYGPVRGLTSTQIGADIKLEWSKPYRATGSTTDEERSITYRVWRANGLSGPYVWSELTGSRITETTYTDVTAQPDTAYTYLVQAWDTASGTGYGSAVTKGVFVTVVPPAITLDVTASPTPALPGENITYTYTAQNTTSRTLTTVAITDDRFGSVGTTPSIPPSGTWVKTYTTSFPTVGARSNIATVTADDGGTPVKDSDSVTVTVAVPSATLSVTPSQDPVKRGTSVNLTYTVRNTGVFPLSSIVITDPVLSGPINIAGPVNAGAVSTQVRSITPSVPVTSTASLSASYSTTTTAAAADALPLSLWEQLFGTSRYDTAVEASKRAFPSGAPAVVVASGKGWADALPASALAGTIGGPLLLSAPTDVPTPVVNEISRLGASTVYIVGGDKVLTDAVRTELAGITGVTQVIRLSGTSRYGTAQAIGERVKTLGGTANVVFVATGRNFPDALAASSLAAALEAPILLTYKDTLPDETKAALTTLAPATIVVCGDVGVVSDAVKTQLGSYASSVVRRGGTSRYDTAKSIVEWGEPLLAPTGPAGAYMATGKNFPDALSGGVLAGLGDGRWSPLLLTDPNTLSTQPAEYIQNRNATLRQLGFLGGGGAMSDSVVNAAKNLLP